MIRKGLILDGNRAPHRPTFPSGRLKEGNTNMPECIPDFQIRYLTKKALCSLAFLSLIAPNIAKASPRNQPGVVLPESSCSAPNFLSARTITLHPSSNSHLNVVRQLDGSYTAYEVANAAPYAVISTTPDFE